MNEDFVTTLFDACGGGEPGAMSEHRPAPANGSRLSLTVLPWDEADPYNPVLEHDATGDRVSVHDDEDSLAYARNQIALVRHLALDQWSDSTE